MFIKPDETLADIVSRNISAATILNEYGVDYFLRGDRNLETACLEDKCPMSVVLGELWDLKDQRTNLVNFQNVSLAELSVYILKTHHSFAEKKVTFIRHTLARLVRENGEHDKRIAKLQSVFHDLCVYLTVHMRHEELVIFPFIRRLGKNKFTFHSISAEVIHPIMAMQEDHCQEVATLKRLSDLTKNYSVTTRADYALQVTYDAMRELERDLKVHMHLENNILFPRALDLAKSTSKNLN
jgi:regulator of cell morphogenesis and NO signaling